MMKRMWVVAWMVAVVQASASATAVLVCDEPVWDFGRLHATAVVTNVFTVRNEGKTSFVVERIISGCGCSSAEISAEVIGPGETAELTAIFSAAGRRGPQRISLWIIEAPPAGIPVPRQMDPRRPPRPALILRMEGWVDW